MLKRYAKHSKKTIPNLTQNGILVNLKHFNIRLYFVLILILLVPSVYKTLRIYYLGELPNDSGFNIASQVLWLNVAFEVIQEALILPLFFIIGKSIKEIAIVSNKIITGFITISVVYLIPVIFLILNTNSILAQMNQMSHLVELSSKYIQLESIAIFLSVAFKFALIIFVLLNKVGKIFLLLLTQTLLSVILDSFLLSQFSFSLNIGVIGIAIANIIVGLFMIIQSFYMLKKENIILNKKRLDFTWLRDWFKIGYLSGLESLIRNSIFI